MPPITPGLDSDFARRHQRVLQSAVARLQKDWLLQPQSLRQYATQQGQDSPMNLLRASDKIFVGAGQGAPAYPLLLQPIVCAIADRIVLAIEASDPTQNLLLATAHHAEPWRHWEEPRHPATTKTLDADAVWGRLSRQLRSQLPTSAPPRTSAVTLGSSLLRNETHQSAGTSQCLTMLLAANLSPQVPVIRNLNGSDLITMHRILRQDVNLRKASRTVLVDWIMPIRRATIPWTGVLQWRLGESVFGQRILGTQDSAISVQSPTPNQLTVAAPESLRTALTNEQQTLSLADKPLVAKVDRAWVYLDRGRAWGLKMNDRLIARVNGDVIKGHVVGHYGPGLGLKSPRGFSIQEGAIVYVRKGQKNTKVGLEWEYDPTSYPTAWPPKPTP